MRSATAKSAIVSALKKLKRDTGGIRLSHKQKKLLDSEAFFVAMFLPKVNYLIIVYFASLYLFYLIALLIRRLRSL